MRTIKQAYTQRTLLMLGTVKASCVHSTYIDASPGCQTGMPALSYHVSEVTPQDKAPVHSKSFA
jgi:hypothetical protein